MACGDQYTAERVLDRELLSSHGFSENQLCLWKYPTMSKIKELKGHTARVLHLATNADGSMVCSAGAVRRRSELNAACTV